MVMALVILPALRKPALRRWAMLIMIKIVMMVTAILIQMLPKFATDLITTAMGTLMKEC